MGRRRLYAVWLFALLTVPFSGVSAAEEAVAVRGVIPAPVSDVRTEGFYELKMPCRFVIRAPHGEAVAADELGSYLGTLGWQPAGKERPDVELRLEPGDRRFASDEAYRLEITPRRIVASARTAAGLFYAVQSLLQISDDGRLTHIACRTIEDAPRFGYRGFMIDVSRHFRSVEFVERQLDAMALFKLNRLHMHLTDGAGWRLEIERYPRLTELAAWRPYADWESWWKGDRRYCEADDPQARGGYYTKEDIRRIVEYARRRHIEVIPEIEMPGHSDEVTAAYPELGCTGVPYKDYDLCPGNEQTFEFLENVLGEVMELFPSEYIHVGGDEAGKSAWRTCPKCQARMQAEGLQDVDELQSYLIHRIERYLNAHGRKLLGWDEILDGGLAPNATVMSWRGVEGGMKALRAGHRAIFSPGEFCYLDYTQDAPFTQPASIGGYTPLRKVYSFEPVSEEMTPEQERLLLGVQANLWAEWIPTDAHYEYMMWPRLMALSEVGWSLPERKSYDAFHARALEASEQLRARGYEPFDLRTEYGERPESLAPKHHLAEGCTVHYATPWSRQYAASGAATLTDGVLGGWTYGDRRWQGFLDSDVDVTVDLGRVQQVHYIGATFMQSAGPYVWMPRQVEIYGSQDGEAYERLTTVHNDISPKCPDLLFKTFAYDGAAEVRYIRYVARSGGIPGGWLFVDELVVQ
ncbi:family 20 glycosylhydrolase [Alistipes sp.]|uniref:glycoside hydrolase family 20 protein n=1 Tax=Alistipes sp. TaxID=1872444 RepID=UPI0025BE9A77|nr:family 20 glycosylhydrolase [Alistipes sp.]